MADAGRIDIEIVTNTHQVCTVRVGSTRPQLARLLVGRSPSAAAQLVPMLFSVCGKAQGLCAKLATDAAESATNQATNQTAVPEPARPQGVIDGPATSKPACSDADLAALVGEIAFEHLWRLWIDWPALLGLPARRQDLAAVAGPLRAAHAALAADSLGRVLQAELGAPLGQGGSVDFDAGLATLAPEAVIGLGGWAPRPAGWPGLLDRLRGLDLPALSRSPALHPHWLPCLSLAQQSGQWPDPWPDDFPQAPTYGGEPAETGPIARHAQHPVVSAWLKAGFPVVARVVARMVAVVECAQVLSGRPHAYALVEVRRLGSGQAVARVETARGQLMHRVSVEPATKPEDRGRIVRYDIVAPTEWNFHPAGTLARALVGLPVRDRAMLQRHVQALVLALDPCVEYGVSWIQA